MTSIEKQKQGERERERPWGGRARLGLQWWDLSMTVHENADRESGWRFGEDDEGDKALGSSQANFKIYKKEREKGVTGARRHTTQQWKEKNVIDFSYTQKVCVVIERSGSSGVKE